MRCLPMHKPGKIGKINGIMLQHSETTFPDKKGTITYIAFIPDLAVPLAFIFYKLNIIMTLRQGGKNRQQ